MGYMQYGLMTGSKKMKTKSAMFIMGIGLTLAAVATALAMTIKPTGAVVGGPVCEVPTDYATIQAAVNVAGCTTINVAPGVYPENVTINRTLTLNGAQVGVDAETRTFAGAGESVVSGTGASTPVFSVNAADVTIDGFSITNTVATGASYGVTVNAAGNNSVIQNNIFDTIVTTAPFADGQATAQAVYLQGGPDGVDVLDNVINNVVSQRSAKGVLLGDNGAANAPDNTTISGNTITNIVSLARGAYGVSVANITGGTDGLVVTDNSFDTLTGNGWVHVVGLEGDTPGAIVSNNDISNIVDQTTTVVTDAAGVFFQLNPSFASVQVNNNNLNVGSTNYGIALHPDLLATAGSAQADGECNWWGSATGPTAASNPGGTGALVTPNVDFAPWLIAPAPGGSCLGGQVATTKEQCKNENWQNVVSASNTPFKNQGDCVSYFATKGRNPANG